MDELGAIMKTVSRAEITDLQQIPNIGPSIAANLRLIGVLSPHDLLGKDPYKLYDGRPKYEAVTALTDAFCKRHLNEEYAEMCRRHTVALARKRPTPLVRGRAEVWACGIVRTIGWANVLDDPKQSPCMKLIAIDPEFGVAESTGQAKSMAIRRMFGIGRLNVNWTLP